MFVFALVDPAIVGPQLFRKMRLQIYSLTAEKKITEKNAKMYVVAKMSLVICGILRTRQYATLKHFVHFPGLCLLYSLLEIVQETSEDSFYDPCSFYV